MERFELNVEAVLAGRTRAAVMAEAAGMDDLLARAAHGEPLADDELVALFLAPGLSTESLLALARARRDSVRSGDGGSRGAGSGLVGIRARHRVDHRR